MIATNFLSSHRVTGFECYSSTRKYRISSGCLLLCFIVIVLCTPSISVSSHTTVSFIHHAAHKRHMHYPAGRTGTTQNADELKSGVGWTRRLPSQHESCIRKTRKSSTTMLLSPNEYTILLSNTANTIAAAQHQYVLHIPNLLEAYGSLLQQYPITTKCITASTLGCIGDAIAQYGAFYQKQKQTNDAEVQPQYVQQNSPIYNPTQKQGLTESDGEIQQQPKVEFEYDLRRGTAFFLFGALYTGAFQHYWFQYLSDHVSSWGQEIGIWDQSAKAGKFSTALMAIADGTRQHDWFTCFDVKLHTELPPPPLAIAAAKVMVNQFVMVPALYMPLFFAMTGFVAGLDAKQSAERCRSLYIPLLVRNYVFWLPVQFIQFLFVPVQWQIPVQAVASLIWTIILSTIGVSNNSSSSTVVATSSDTEEALPLPETTMVASAVAFNGQQLSTTFTNANTEDNEVLDWQNEQSAAAAESKAAIDSLGLLDDIRVEDVIPEPILGTANRILLDNKVGAAGGGFAIGLLTAAADEAFVGSVVGSILGGDSQLGVAFMSAVGAGVGILAATAASAVAENNDYHTPSADSIRNLTESMIDSLLDNNMTANQDPADRYAVEINLLGDKVALTQYQDNGNDFEIIPIHSNGSIDPVVSIGDLSLITTEDDSSNPELLMEKLKTIDFTESASNGQYEQQSLPFMSSQVKIDRTTDKSMHKVEAGEGNLNSDDTSNEILFVKSYGNGHAQDGKHHDDAFSANATVHSDHLDNEHISILCEHNENSGQDVLCFNNCENIIPLDDKKLSIPRQHNETIGRPFTDNETEVVTTQQAIPNPGQLEKIESIR